MTTKNRSIFLAIAFALDFWGAAMAQEISAPDPFVMFDTQRIGYQQGTAPFRPGWADTNGKNLRSLTINPAVKTLVLISAGQSNRQNISPTLYIPTNSTVIDNFNVYDGAAYDVNGPMVGTNYVPDLASGGVNFGPGHVMARVADKFVSNGIFARVIVVPIAIGGSSIADWDPGAAGVLANRIPVAMARLAARGITPATTGVTFGLEWGQGENDNLAGTTQAAYQAAWGRIVAGAQAAGFSGRFFVAKETWDAGNTSAVIRAAQTAVVDNVTTFASGDIDTLNGSNRYADSTHLNDTGAAAAATLIYNAMHASGAPY
jgi:hypothetical protein